MTAPTTIWLEPWCHNCAKAARDYGRTWCTDEFGPCPQCGAMPVKYVRAGAALSEDEIFTLQAAIENLRVAERSERTIQAAWRIAHQLAQLVKRMERQSQ